MAEVWISFLHSTNFLLHCTCISLYLFGEVISAAVQLSIVLVMTFIGYFMCSHTYSTKSVDMSSQIHRCTHNVIECADTHICCTIAHRSILQHNMHSQSQHVSAG